MLSMEDKEFIENLIKTTVAGVFNEYWRREGDSNSRTALRQSAV